MALVGPGPEQVAGWLGPRGGVPDATRLGRAGVDGGMLLGLAGVGQVGEEVRPLHIEPAVEERIEAPQDRLARV